MLRFLTVLITALLGVSCDQPDKAEAAHNSPASNEPVKHRRRVLREPAPNQSAALREIFQNALTIESPAAREKALADVAWCALETAPGLAQEAFQRLPKNSPEKIRLIQHYALRLAEQNPDEAIDWAAALETEQETAAAMGYIALEIAETDPLRAANLLSESGIAGRDFDVAVVQVIQRWAAQSASDAAAWVSSFPPGAFREAGIKVIAGQWLPQDAPAAFAWLEQMQDAHLRAETARAMEGVILQQPRHIRDAWLQHADAGIQRELEQQRSEALKDIGDNLPPSAE
jgi:hypothetical protein